MPSIKAPYRHTKTILVAMSPTNIERSGKVSGKIKARRSRTNGRETNGGRLDIRILLIGCEKNPINAFC
jgi:hypothetical protein